MKFKSLVTNVQDISRLNLPIATHLENISELIHNEPSILVEAPSGTGKSLGIPWMMARQGLRVVISVQSEMVAESLSQRQQFLNPELKVGYATNTRMYYDQETQIIYVTSHHLRRQLINFYVPNESLISSTDLIILDDVDDGSLDNTFIYSLWEYGRKRDVSLPRLILLSSTPLNKYPDIKRYKITLERFPVDVFYHKRNYRPSDKQLITDTATVILRFLSELDGDILVFLANKYEIKILQSILEKKPINAVILQVYEGISIDKIYRNENSFSGNFSRDVSSRRVILSTNILQNSLTVSGIRVVIDTLTEKFKDTSPVGGLRTTLGYISQTSAIQRKERVSRSTRGICYRMMTAEYFSNLPKERVDEIQRVPIYHVLLELLEAGLNPKDILENIDGPLKLIDFLGLRDANIGNFVSEVPLSIRNATLLWKWIEAGHPIYPCIVILSLLEAYGPSYFFYPFQNPGQSNMDYIIFREEHREKYFQKFAGKSDLDTLINMWNDFTDSVGGPNREAKTWTIQNSINHKRLKDAISVLFKTIHILKQRFNLSVDVRRFTLEGVMREFRPLAESIYNDMIMYKVPGSQPNYYHNDDIYILDSYDSVNNFYRDYPLRIIPFVIFETRGGAKKINIALDLEESENNKIELSTGSEFSIVPTIRSTTPQL